MRTITLCAALLTLAACTANVVRLERAGTASTQAAAVKAAVGAYVADAQTRRREASVALVASDPSCSWADQIVVDMSPDERKKRRMCDLAGVPQARRMTISLRPIPLEALRPTVMSVAGLATFQAALAEALDAKPAEARAEIEGAIDALSTAASDINRITGGESIDLGPLTGERGKAVSTLIGALVELRATELKVRKVRSIVERTDTTRLYAQLNTAVASLADLQNQNSAAELRSALVRVYASDREGLSFAERRDLVRQIALARDEAEGVGAARLRVLTDGLAELGASDAKLRRALAGEFTTEERRRIARENREQALALLTKIAAVFPAI